jgi:hypothetical protein
MLPLFIRIINGSVVEIPRPLGVSIRVFDQDFCNSRLNPAVPRIWNPMKVCLSDCQLLQNTARESARLGVAPFGRVRWVGRGFFQGVPWYACSSSVSQIVSSFSKGSNSRLKREDPNVPVFQFFCSAIENPLLYLWVISAEFSERIEIRMGDLFA